MTLSRSTFSIMTMSIRDLFVTFSINDTEHNNALHYAECCYGECRILFIVMLSVVQSSLMFDDKATAYLSEALSR